MADYTPVTETDLTHMETPALHAALQERKSRADEIVKPFVGKAAAGQNPIELLGADDWALVKKFHGDAQMIQGVINDRVERKEAAASFDRIGKAATSVAGMPGLGAVKGAGDDGGDPGWGPMTPGQAFVMSDDYREQKAAGVYAMSAKQAMSTGMLKQFSVNLDYYNSFPVYRKAMSIMARSYPEFFLGRKGTAINTGASSGGGFVLPEFDLVPEQLARASLDVMGLLRLQPTDTNLIEWLRQDTRITGASTVPEYTDTADSVTQKPEGGATWSLQTMAVKTIAVHVAVVNQQLNDAPEIRGIIDEDLRFEVDEELNSQVLSGGGTGNDMTGILTALTAASISAITYDPGTPSHDNILDALLDAWVTIRVANEPAPTGTLVHWRDWERARTVKASGTGDYILGSPSAGMGPLMLWDIPLVGTNNMTEGDALVGNFQSARLHMREETNVRLGYANNDFLANRVRLLAELRACVTVRRPGAFRKVTGLNS